MNRHDVQRIRNSPVWRSERMEMLPTDDGQVLVKGQRPARGNFGYAVLNLLARATGSRLLQAVPMHGGAAAQAVEVRRLGALYASGVRVPRLLHVDTEFFAMEFVPGPNLASLLAAKPANGLALWERGLQALQAVHARGEYLSQAHARNFIVSGDELVAIDFEDDPAEVMTLAEAQAHDWLVYLLSTAWLLPSLQAQMLALWRQAVPGGSAHGALLHKAALRLGWLRHLPRKRKPWGRDIVSAQATGSFLHQWARERQPT
ncbi:MAG: hypothetical protein V4757_18035 [Pseudomonadota bacterium]